MFYNVHLCLSDQRCNNDHTVTKHFKILELHPLTKTGCNSMLTTTTDYFLGKSYLLAMQQCHEIVAPGLDSDCSNEINISISLNAECHY